METKAYRPEIDGLRAIAVLAVLVFHLDPAWLPGGFAGVDVFFVISGYLITGILRRELEAGTFSFLTFFQRRVARIFPAFLAMAGTTLAAAAWLFTEQDFSSTAVSFAAAVASWENLHLLSLGSYFTLPPDSQPLLHCWSLSVEEQFYLVFPVLLWFTRKAGHPARIQAWLFGFLTVASLGACILVTRTNAPLAFYLLPTRAWELLAGSLAALAVFRRPSFLHPEFLWTKWGFWTGLAAVLGSLILLREGPHFPGWVALFPVLGTLAVLTAPLPKAGRFLLGARPVVIVGKLSYSLYLWHWPVFSLTDYALPYLSFPQRLLLKTGLTAIAAVLCHVAIENPCRAWLNRPRRRTLTLSGAAVVIAVLTSAGLSLHRQHYLDGGGKPQGALRFDQPGATRTLVLMGDSQGSMYATLLRQLAAAHQWNLVVLSVAGGDPLAPAPGDPPGPLWQEGLAEIQRLKPDAILLANHWAYKLTTQPARLEETLKALQPLTSKIILLTQPPLLPASATRAAIRNGSRPPFHEDAADTAWRKQPNETVRAAAAAAGAGRPSLPPPDSRDPAVPATDQASIHLIEVEPLFLRTDGSLILENKTGRPLFQDRVHLSRDGAGLIIPLLEPLLRNP